MATPSSAFVTGLTQRDLQPPSTQPPSSPLAAFSTVSSPRFFQGFAPHRLNVSILQLFSWDHSRPVGLSPLFLAPSCPITVLCRSFNPCPSQSFEFQSLIIAPCMELEARLLPFCCIEELHALGTLLQQRREVMTLSNISSSIPHHPSHTHTYTHTHSHAHIQIQSKTASSSGLSKGVGDGFYLLQFAQKLSLGFLPVRAFESR